MSAEVSRVETDRAGDRFDRVSKITHSQMRVRARFAKKRRMRVRRIDALKGYQLRNGIHEFAPGKEFDSGRGEGCDVLERGALSFSKDYAFRSFSEAKEVLALRKKLKVGYLTVLKTRLATSQETGETTR